MKSMLGSWKRPPASPTRPFHPSVIGELKFHELVAAMSGTSASFGLRDYQKMLQKRGLRLPVAYFLNAHLFDLLHGTDTHTWLPKERYAEHPPNFDSGVLYMTSWTDEIRRAYRALQKLGLLGDYAFVDVGCGKGKVCMTWKMLEQNHQSCARIIGIDYYEPLVETSKNNFSSLFQSQGEFYCADATTFDFKGLNRRLVVYFYNPFNDLIMAQVLKNLPLDTVIIYTNPVHCDLLIESGFEVIHQHHGWHPNAQTKIFRSTNARQCS